MEKTAAVIGAGMGGLSAAARLASAGFNVELFEQKKGPGGKADSLNLGPFRFDKGPSLFTMPHVFRDLFSQCGRNMDDYLKLRQLKEVTRYFYPDGTRLKSSGDMKEYARNIAAATNDSFEDVFSYMNLCRKMFRSTEEIFLWNDPRDINILFSRNALKALFSIPPAALRKNMHDFSRKHLSDPRAVQLFDRYATFNGSSPYKAKGIFNLISAMETDGMALMPEGGIYSLVLAMTKLAEESGVKIHYNTKVNRIAEEKNIVTGVEIEGELRKFDIVISNLDAGYTLSGLLEGKKEKISGKLAGQEPSSSGLVFFWGISREFSELGLHNIFFSSDYRKEFDMLFSGKGSEIYHDPTVYINITSKTEKNDAPEGMENWFVLVNAPSIKNGQDWEKISNNTRKNILEKLSRMLDENPEKYIKEERILAPPDIENDTGSRLGSLYGTASHSWKSAFMRLKNRYRKIRGLYFCGGSVHPGGGMPLAVLSGRIAAEKIKKDFL